jgi:hypothetical protein
MVSKKLQEKIVCIDATLQHIDKVIEYFQNYRNVGFSASIDSAKAIASNLGIEPKFRTKRQSKRKKHFDEVNDEGDELQLSATESFKVTYFLVVVDKAIASLNDRFVQLKEFEKVFGFLFNSKKLKSLDDLLPLSSDLVSIPLPPGTITGPEPGAFLHHRHVTMRSLACRRCTLPWTKTMASTSSESAMSSRASPASCPSCTTSLSVAKSAAGPPLPEDKSLVPRYVN